MRLFFLCLSIIVSQLLHSQFCTPDHRFTERDYFSDHEITVQRDLMYASATNWQNRTDTLLLDAYLPDQAFDSLPLRPAVLLVHGGGFARGNKEEMDRECRSFARKGFVAFSIQYRLGLSISDPYGQVKAAYRAHQDALAALRFIVHHANTFRVDTHHIFIGGESAGSFTSLNVAYVSQAEWNALFPWIQNDLGSLSGSGNTFNHTVSVKGVFSNWGGTFSYAVQPSDSVPMIAFHGELDQDFFIDSTFVILGSRAIHNRFVRNAVCSDLTVKINGGHGIYNDSLGDNFRVGRASCFFKSVMCNSCNSNYTTDSIPATCSGAATSLENKITQTEIRVYPNPFHSKLFVKDVSGEEVYILIESSGRSVYTGTRLEKVNLGGLAPGPYHLIVRRGDKVQTFLLSKR